MGEEGKRREERWSEGPQVVAATARDSRSAGIRRTRATNCRKRMNGDRPAGRPTWKGRKKLHIAVGSRSPFFKNHILLFLAGFNPPGKQGAVL